MSTLVDVQIALHFSLSLDRDSAKWNLDEEESYRRRCLMWEIYTYDSLQVGLLVDFHLE